MVKKEEFKRRRAELIRFLEGIEPELLHPMELTFLVNRMRSFTDIVISSRSAVGGKTTGK